MSGQYLYNPPEPHECVIDYGTTEYPNSGAVWVCDCGQHHHYRVSAWNRFMGFRGTWHKISKKKALKIAKKS